MTRLIAIASGKGGVGKTTMVANIGSALADMKKDVVILDANLTTPNLGMHLGIPLFPVTLHDVLKRKADISKAIYTDKKNGLKIIPAGISINDMIGVDARDLPNVLLDLLGRTDIVLVDVAAGLGREALSAIESCDEMITVTTPELPATADSLKAIKVAENARTHVNGVIVNRVTNSKHQMNDKELQEMFEGLPILAKISEDPIVQESISEKTPVVRYKPKSEVSQKIRHVAAHLVGEEYITTKPWHRRLFGFIFK